MVQTDDEKNFVYKGSTAVRDGDSGGPLLCKKGDQWVAIATVDAISGGEDPSRKIYQSLSSLRASKWLDEKIDGSPVSAEATNAALNTQISTYCRRATDCQQFLDQQAIQLTENMIQISSRIASLDADVEDADVKKDSSLSKSLDQLSKSLLEWTADCYGLLREKLGIQ